MRIGQPNKEFWIREGVLSVLVLRAPHCSYGYIFVSVRQHGHQDHRNPWKLSLWRTLTGLESGQWCFLLHNLYWMMNTLTSFLWLALQSWSFIKNFSDVGFLCCLLLNPQLGQLAPLQPLHAGHAPAVISLWTFLLIKKNLVNLIDWSKIYCSWLCYWFWFEAFWKWGSGLCALTGTALRLLRCFHYDWL